MGSIHHNPFDFKNYSVTFINATVSGAPAPRGPIILDFESGQYIQAYDDLYRGKKNVNPNKRIKLQEYPSGYSLFVIDLAPQNENRYWPVNRQGNVRLEIRFARPLPEAAILFTKVSFPSEFSLDYSRNVFPG